ncbi:hypothetical protein [Maritimibacter fusiformis]|uniref:DUF3618 domain-containing protein n=1 Tax=Maritimibacter fusiformis TaxID=2603819 RepID=A0A5D0RI41_9RHOB|nr:hypothetical protein [Maritimibacter fusiformis]TYB81270.1 hypothetical protein FVF75_09075 [Maritimibacter fusiformis]
MATKSKKIARDAKERVKATVKDLADETAEMAREELDDGKAALRAKGRDLRDAAADEIDETGEAARDAAGRFDDDDYRHRAAAHLADALDGLAERLRQREPGQMRADVEDFARKNPLLFYAGAALGGFALARLAKATGREGADASEEDPDEDYPFRDDIPGYPDRKGRVTNGDARR